MSYPKEDRDATLAEEQALREEIDKHTTFTPKEDPKELYCGWLEYDIGPFTVWVFLDCGEWDYIEGWQLPSGEVVGSRAYTDDPDKYDGLLWWRPEDATTWGVDE